MQVEIWSDVVCPWCAIGKARLERTLADLPYRDEVEIRWRSFELDPHAPSSSDAPNVERLAAKYRVSLDEAHAMVERVERTAAADGLEFDLHHSRPGNTFDAHRILHLAADRGRQHEVKDRFLRGYHSEREPIADHDTLTRLAVEAGLDEPDVQDTLASDAYADAVRADEAQAYEFGCSGVPFFVIDRRFAVMGAQPSEVLRGALDKAHEAAQPLEMVTSQEGSDPACDDGACAI